MKQHVVDFVRWCLTCQQVKAEHQKPTGLLQSFEVAKWKWEHVMMDFVTHLPQTPRRHDVVWVIVDWLTKSSHFLAMRMPSHWRNYVGCIFVRFSGYIECQSLSYQTGIPGLRHTFGRVSKRLWGHN